MIKVLGDTNNAFVRKEPVENLIPKLKQLREEKLLHANVEDPQSFFSLLHDFCMKHKTASRKKRKNIEAMGLWIMIPENLHKQDELVKFIKEFSKRALRSLPYAAYYVTKGERGRYIYFLVSERRYKKEDEYIEIRQRSDLYQKKDENGKVSIAKKGDPGAYLVYEKGKLHRRIKVHFTKKNRLFTGNEAEFQHKMDTLKRVVVTILTEIHYSFVQRRSFFRKINIKEARRNYYHHRNIIAFNHTLEYFEMRINKAEDTLLQGYMEEELEQLNKIKFMYLHRVRNLRFKYGRIPLSLDWKRRCDLFRENLETFIRIFDQDMEEFYIDLERYVY